MLVSITLRMTKTTHCYPFVRASKKWNGKPRLACVNIQHPASKNHLGASETYISCMSLGACTVLDTPESKEMTEQIDWWAKQPAQAGCVSEDLKC